MRADSGCWHFGVLTAAGDGHLNPFLALARELTARGHRVTFFGKPKQEPLVRGEGFAFVPLAQHVPQSSQAVGRWRLRDELAWLRVRLKRVCAEVEMCLAEAPQAIAQAGVNALLVDEIALAGPTVAELVRLPWFIVSTSVPHRFGWKNSSWLTGYRSSKSALSWLQSVFLELSVLRMRGPVLRTIDSFRAAAGLGPARNLMRDYPCLAHIAQLPRCLDLPRRRPPNDFFHAGPFAGPRARPCVPFPWERLDGRRLIYVSLGTTSHTRPSILRIIAEACSTLDVQLVISLGNRAATDGLQGWPGAPIVVRYAPQLELLERADVVITHAGLNTSIEALMAGKPMIAIPLAFDQPAVAARLRHLGVAETLPVMRLTPKRIRRAAEKVLSQARYADAALAMQAELDAMRGAENAAAIIERALSRHVHSVEVLRTAPRRQIQALSSYPAHASDSSASTASLKSL